MLKDNVMVLLNYLMTAVFLYAAGVQFNDPDMAGWILVYGSAAVASFLYAVGRFRLWFAILTLVIALFWAAFLIPELLEDETFSFSVFASVEMTNMENETAREFGGLIIVTIWMAVISMFSPSAREV